MIIGHVAHTFCNIFSDSSQNFSFCDQKNAGSPSTFEIPQFWGSRLFFFLPGGCNVENIAKVVLQMFSDIFFLHNSQKKCVPDVRTTGTASIFIKFGEIWIFFFFQKKNFICQKMCHMCVHKIKNIFF